MVDDVVPKHHVAGCTARMFAGDLGKIRIVDQVALDNDSCAAIAVVSARTHLVVIDRVRSRTDVVDGVLEDPAVARLVIARVGRHTLETNVVQPDIVAVMDKIIRFDKVLHIPIE